MPIKHQASSYRTRKGERYENDGDIFDGAMGDLKVQAKARVNALQASGRKAFSEKHDGYYRVFATPRAE
jgi:hypothetical protein